MTWLVEEADVLEWAGKYDGPKFHAILCDPPYHLFTMTVPRPDLMEKHGREGGNYPKARIAARTGFMNSKWDGDDIALRPETWAALAALLHPGAFIFAFAGTRGYHRMACAMEDSGLILHPAIAGRAP
ncbi:MAG: hypothetical protein JO166_14100 [Deltaproteobacteria bacterium]|nr:hypothetical protein [Deltaproteobacteria bacterium]